MKVEYTVKARGWAAELRGSIDALDVTIRNKSGEAVCVGMYQHEMLDCGEDGVRIPTNVFDALDLAIDDFVTETKFSMNEDDA